MNTAERRAKRISSIRIQYVDNQAFAEKKIKDLQKTWWESDQKKKVDVEEFAIQVHGGFFIKAYVEQYRNTSLTQIVGEALKFATKADAEAFIELHDGQDHGFSKRTAKIRAFYKD